MNPCPCGYYGDNEKTCNCSAYEVFKYQKKISGPLLDRIDIQIEVPRVKLEELIKPKEKNTSNNLKDKVIKARKIQAERFSKTSPKIYLNSEMPSKTVDEIVNLADESQKFIKDILNKSFISARGYYRMLKTSRTIADLDESEKVLPSHLAEAFQYRIREK